MWKIVFDTMIYDRIVESGILSELLELSSKRVLEYLITHVQIDEIAAISDDKAEKRKRLFLTVLRLRPKIVSTEGAILDASRFDYARFGDNEVLDEIRRQSKELNPSRDALIATTAMKNADVLGGARPTRQLNIEFLPFESFIYRLEELRRSSVRL